MSETRFDDLDYKNPGFNIDELQIGDKSPYFCLTGTDNLIHSLSDFAGSPCLVVIFTSNLCPYALSYESRIIDLYNKYRSNGVEFVAICSNDGTLYPAESFDNMKMKNFPFPYLHDESQIVARAFGAQATPEVFVFDQDQCLKYHGAIDDNPELSKDTTIPYLNNAIKSVLTSSVVPHPKAPLIGCSIKWSI